MVTCKKKQKRTNSKCLINRKYAETHNHWSTFQCANIKTQTSSLPRWGILIVMRRAVRVTLRKKRKQVRSSNLRNQKNQSRKSYDALLILSNQITQIFIFVHQDFLLLLQCTRWLRTLPWRAVLFLRRLPRWICRRSQLPRDSSLRSILSRELWSRNLS